MNERLAGAPAARDRPYLLARYTLLLGLAALVVALDQITKAFVADKLSGGRVVDILGGVVSLDYTMNTGAAFSFFRSGSAVFALVAIAVSVAIVIYFRRVASSPLLVRVALGMILGGALGNLIDRIRLGYVVDFIDLHWFPVFNLADSAITMGVSLIVLYAIFQPESWSE